MSTIWIVARAHTTDVSTSAPRSVTSTVFEMKSSPRPVTRTSFAMLRGAESYLLDTFAAVYLGTLLGALFITSLGNGLTLLGLGAPYRYALNGGFILLDMAIGVLKRNH